MSDGMKCANCGKGVMYGHKVSHAKNRSNRLFKPNLHAATIMVAGSSKHVRLCTKCLRTAKKEAKKLTNQESASSQKAAQAVL